MNSKVREALRALPVWVACLVGAVGLQACELEWHSYAERSRTEIDSLYFANDTTKYVVRMIINGEMMASYSSQAYGGTVPWKGEIRSLNYIYREDNGPFPASLVLLAKINKYEFVRDKEGSPDMSSDFAGYTMYIILPESYAVNEPLDLASCSVIFESENNTRKVKIKEGSLVIDELCPEHVHIFNDGLHYELYAKGHFKFSGDGGNTFGEINCTDGFFYTYVVDEAAQGFGEANPDLIKAEVQAYE